MHTAIYNLDRINLFKTFFLVFVAETHQSLYISNERLVKRPGESAFVTCKDQANSKNVVKWENSNGWYEINVLLEITDFFHFR